MEVPDCKPGVPVIYWSHRSPDGVLGGASTQTVITSHVMRNQRAYVVLLQDQPYPVDIRNLVPNNTSTF